jgi:polysaccharide deacetylase family protein (PEP-CTERM system associated)
MTNAAAIGAATTGATRPRHAMTVDVEDYFQVYAFFRCIPRDSWDGYAHRVEANVERILAQFAAANVTATFFTLGWIAERHPAMIRRIVDAGHELASHGYDHTRVDAMDAAAFREDLRRTRGILQDTGGVGVRGYRAPTFSIGPTTPWAFEIIAAEGHAYSSSVNPVRHDNYGMPDAPRTPYHPQAGGHALWEFPMTTVRLFGRNLPCSGGGYFRLLPYGLFRRGFTRATEAEGHPGIFYFHPWEVDPDQPRVPGCGWKSRLRHYTNLARMSARLDQLLVDFAWDRMDRVFATELAGVPAGGIGATDANPVPGLGDPLLSAALDLTTAVTQADVNMTVDANLDAILDAAVARGQYAARKPT